METGTKVSRKIFIRVLGGLGTGLFLWLWYRLSENRVTQEERAAFRHGTDVPMGVSHCGRYYLFRDVDGVRAYSTTCTHAGCRIGKSNTGIMHCGCHGSQFEAATGKAIKGPAYRPLHQYDCSFDPVSAQWIVKLGS